MTILLEQYPLPEQGIVELNIHYAFDIKVTAQVARRKVNLWLLDQVSYMMGAETPTLVIGEQIAWRVPVILTAPHVGTVGEVGFIDVDVQTGGMNISPERIAVLQKQGIELGKKMPPYKPGRQVAPEYLAKNLQPTHSKPARHKKQPTKHLLAVAAD